MFFQKKEKEEKNTNTYFYVCITCIQKEGAAERRLESGAAFQTAEMTSATSEARRLWGEPPDPRERPSPGVLGN